MNYIGPVAMDESKFIEDGRVLGYSGSSLVSYVEQRRLREESRMKADAERDERREAREEAKAAREEAQRKDEFEVEKKRQEIEAKRLELEIAKAGQSETTPTSTPNSAIKLAQFVDTEDVAVYLTNFERVKKINQWSEECAMAALMNGFSGTKVSSFINSCQLTTYEDLKVVILQTFGLSIYDVQARFRNSKQSSESISQLVLNLGNNLDRLCTLAEIGDEFKNLRSFVIKEQLLRSVDNSLASFLKENDIYKLDLDKVTTLAENFQAIHGKPRFKSHPDYDRSRTSSFVDKNSTSNSKEKSCYICGGSHLARFCSLKFNNSLESEKNVQIKSSDKNSFKCYICKDPSHLARFCPSKNKKDPQNNADTNGEVLGISLSNSYRGKLPTAQGKCNGKRVTVLRDTGATTIVVKPYLVQSKYFTGDQVKVRYADGRIKSLPLAQVNIRCPYFNGTTIAAVERDLPFDVLVGNVKDANCACINEEELSRQKVSVDDDEYNDCICSVQTRSQSKSESIPCKVPKIGVGPITFDLPNISRENLIQMQKNDKTLESSFQKSNEISNSYPKIVMRNGVLVRISNLGKNINELVNQVILPKQLRDDVLSVSHDTLLAGHLGVNKTLSRIKAHFYWPGMTGDVSRYVRSCEVCQKNSSCKPPKVPLVTPPLIDTPFSRVAIDIIGPMPKSAKGNRFALVMIDLATKFPDAVPLKYIDANTVAESLFDMFSRVGLPKEILHDQGTNFMSRVMTRFNDLLRIKSIHTTPYHPMCNGTCENFNKTLKTMLRKICHEEPDMWDRYVQPLLFAYREVPQCSTGYSPFELVFGYHVRGPLFLIKEKFLAECEEAEDVPITKYVFDMRNRVKEFMENAKINENVSKSKQKVYYDKNTRKRNYKVGDKVLLLLPTSSNKLLAEWKGPYEIVRRLNKVDYIVRIMDKERVYHVNMLKPFYERKSTSLSELEEVNLVESQSETFDINPDLNETNKTSFCRVLAERDYVFSKTPGKVEGIEYDIKIDPKVKPIAVLPYKIPYALKDQVKTTLNEWLELGIIRKSSSPWSAPVVVVKNNDGSIRLTIDFRKINSHVNCDNFPMPDRDVVIEKLGKSKYLTKLDLTKAYLQIPLSEESRKFTSFVVEGGQYEFCVVPFGIKFASGLCNRIINELLSECEGFVTGFVDDLMIFSENFEEHVEHVKCVIDKLSEAGVTLNKSKCKFGYHRVKFLGFIVGNGETLPDPAKVKAIRDFPKPTNKKELRSYLGLLSFYRKFVPNLASCLSLLTDLLKKSSYDKLRWTETLDKIFEESRSLISDDIKLSIPVPGKTFILQTDASLNGLGAMLIQEGECAPISFISRKLKPAERNYSVIELECLAIKWAIEYFYQYLYGSKFIVRTDHAPLTWLVQNKDKNSRLMRWALSLQAYDFSVQYVKGSENFIADAFSRYPTDD